MAAADFKKQMAAFKRAIDEDIAEYAAHVRNATKRQYGVYPEVVTDAYLNLLAGGGKRIRGALVMVGYEMCGGSNSAMIVRAASAVEMIHASMLAVDDIQDRSATRRGQPAVHAALAAYARRQGWPRADYTGISLTLDGALSGLFGAHVLLAELDVDPQLRLKVIGTINQALITTVHGQTNDIANALATKPDPEAIARTREWKSAHYTFLNPLCVGMVLAGAGCEHTDAIREYALNTGMAFQITDDILDGDVAPRDIPAARQAAAQHVHRAVASLDSEAHRWTNSGRQFLKDLAEYILGRTA